VSFRALILSVVLCIALAGCCSTAMLPPTVFVDCVKEPGRWTSTGIVLETNDRQTTILAAAHAVPDGSATSVWIGRDRRLARTIAIDRANDLILLRCNGAMDVTPPILGDWVKGRRVITLTTYGPFAEPKTVTGWKIGYDVLVDADIIGGNSGGAVIDQGTGELHGMLVTKYPHRGRGRMVPVSIIKNFLINALRGDE